MSIKSQFFHAFNENNTTCISFSDEINALTCDCPFCTILTSHSHVIKVSQMHIIFYHFSAWWNSSWHVFTTIYMWRPNLPHFNSTLVVFRKSVFQHVAFLQKLGSVLFKTLKVTLKRYWELDAVNSLLALKHTLTSIGNIWMHISPTCNIKPKVNFFVVNRNGFDRLPKYGNIAIYGAPAPQEVQHSAW